MNPIKTIIKLLSMADDTVSDYIGTKCVKMHLKTTGVGCDGKFSNNCRVYLKTV